MSKNLCKHKNVGPFLHPCVLTMCSYYRKPVWFSDCNLDHSWLLLSLLLAKYISARVFHGTLVNDEYLLLLAGVVVHAFFVFVTSALGCDRSKSSHALLRCVMATFSQCILVLPVHQFQLLVSQQPVYLCSMH